MNKADKHSEICAQLTDTYRKKNNDYGDSFAQLRARLPNAILTRLFDKYLRLETLLTGATQEVKDESITDTLLDMANYCIMEVIEREIDKSKLTSPIAPAPLTDEIKEEMFEGVKPSKWEGYTTDELMNSICIIFDGDENGCSKCPLNNVGKSGYKCSGKYMTDHPTEARRIMLDWLEKEGN